MILLLTLLASAQPALYSGPDLAEKAQEVVMPIDHVRVFSDQAHVTRQTKTRLKPGIHILRISDIPGALLKDTLRVSSSKGSEVLRVESSPIDRERFSITQVDAWITELEALDDESYKKERALKRAQKQIQILRNLRAAPLVSEKDRMQKSIPIVAPQVWQKLLSDLAERRVALRAKESQLDDELRELNKKSARLRRQIQEKNIGAFSNRQTQVLLVLDVKTNSAHTLTMTYAMPGAFWRPSYDLFFNADDKSVELKASAQVTQATGEDWNNAALSFSTSMPDQNIALPELLTWTLGDERELIPRPRAKTQPIQPTRFKQTRPKPTLEEIERTADAAFLRQKTQTLWRLASRTPSDGAKDYRTTTFDFSDVDIDGDLTKPEAAYLAERERAEAAASKQSAAKEMARATRAKRESRRRSARRSQNAPEYDQDESEDAPIALESISSTISGVVARAGGAAQARRRESLELFSSTRTQRRLSDPSLPANLAGGLDIVYDAPSRTDVKSQASNLRVGFASRRFDVKTFYEATPALSKNAFLKARVKNDAGVPILAGPANVFVDGAFVGDARLATTDKGGFLEMPLGADPDIRLTHTVIPKTQSEGVLFGKKDVTDYEVTIEVGNYKKRQVVVYVTDVIPKTNNDKMQIEVKKMSPALHKKIDGEGKVLWRLKIAAGKTKTIKYRYRVIRPAGWKVTQ